MKKMALLLHSVIIVLVDVFNEEPASAIVLHYKKQNLLVTVQNAMSQTFLIFGRITTRPKIQLPGQEPGKMRTGKPCPLFHHRCENILQYFFDCKDSGLKTRRLDSML